MLEGRRISFEHVLEAADILMERIRESRSPTADRRFLSDFADHPSPPVAVTVCSRAEVSAEVCFRKRPSQPPRQRTQAREPSNTEKSRPALIPQAGTADPSRALRIPSSCGRRFPARNRVFWERRPIRRPGRLRRRVGRPAPVASPGGHRGTVSWEEHADRTQDEIRAEAELAELKRSRPRRGEAKLRLRELMRRFPQTEAAIKARRMLERLESGQ